MLENTKLGVVLDQDQLVQVQMLGELHSFTPGQTIFDAGSDPDYLDVILNGDLNIIPPNSDHKIWLGAGDIVGEVGFILDTPRTAAAVAGYDGTRLWRLPRARLVGKRTPRETIALTRVMLALSPYVRVRTAKLEIERKKPDDLATTHINHEHPAIQRMAVALQRDSEWATIRAVWRYVSSLPYRIGYWQLRASDTLHLGFGMCTTKASLQTALHRALGFEAAATEVLLTSGAMLPLLPEGYHHLVARKPQIRHYLGMVYVDGQWYPMDATYAPEVWQLWKDAKRRQNPQRIASMNLDFKFGHPFNPNALYAGTDPYDCEPMENLGHVMDKRPFYDADNIEAMNIVLDRVQGSFLPSPQWVPAVAKLIAHDPTQAFYRAYAGMVCELGALHEAIATSQQMAEVEQEKIDVF